MKTIAALLAAAFAFGPPSTLDEAAQALRAHQAEANAILALVERTKPAGRIVPTQNMDVPLAQVPHTPELDRLLRAIPALEADIVRGDRGLEVLSLVIHPQSVTRGMTIIDAVWFAPNAQPPAHYGYQHCRPAAPGWFVCNYI